MDMTNTISNNGAAMIASLEEATTLMAHVIHQSSKKSWDACRLEARALTEEADTLVDIGSVPPIPGAIQALKTLTQHHVLIGIVTGDNRNRTQQQLKNWDLDSCIDVIVTADDVRQQKPDPESLNKALAALQLDVSQAILVGDSINDWRMAEVIGMPMVAIGKTIDTPSDNIKANLPDLRSLVVLSH